MSSTDNPYSPPSAELGSATLSGEEFPPDGDLAGAIEGGIQLSFEPVVREGWRLVSGTKLMSHLVFSVIGLLYTVAIVVLFAAFLYDDFSTLMVDPEAFADTVEALGESPVYFLTTTLVFAPFNALVYVAMWSLGMHRAAHGTVTFKSAFDTSVTLKTIGILLLLSPVSLAGMLHPLFSLLSLPLTALVIWCVPLFVDRRMGFMEAIGVSSRLTLNNWVSLMLLGLLMLAGYILSTITCGIGLIWYLPWSCTVLGAAWRQLCGFELLVR